MKHNATLLTSQILKDIRHRMLMICHIVGIVVRLIGSHSCRKQHIKSDATSIRCWFHRSDHPSHHFRQLNVAHLDLVGGLKSVRNC